MNNKKKKVIKKSLNKKYKKPINSYLDKFELGGDIASMGFNVASDALMKLVTGSVGELMGTLKGNTNEPKLFEYTENTNRPIMKYGGMMDYMAMGGMVGDPTDPKKKQVAVSYIDPTGKAKTKRLQNTLSKRYEKDPMFRAFADAEMPMQTTLTLGELNPANTESVGFKVGRADQVEYENLATWLDNGKAVEDKMLEGNNLYRKTSMKDVNKRFKEFKKNYKNLDTTKESSPTKTFAKGGMVGMPNAEVEGGEIYELPDGEIGQFEGPDHSEGGIKINAPAGTEIKSKQIKDKDGKSIADAEKAMAKEEKRLEDAVKERPFDVFLKNSLARVKQRNEIKSTAHEQIQEYTKQKEAADKAVEGMQQATEFVAKYGGTIPKYAQGGLIDLLSTVGMEALGGLATGMMGMGMSGGFNKKKTSSDMNIVETDDRGTNEAEENPNIEITNNILDPTVTKTFANGGPILPYTGLSMDKLLETAKTSEQLNNYFDVLFDSGNFDLGQAIQDQYKSLGYNQPVVSQGNYTAKPVYTGPIESIPEEEPLQTIYPPITESELYIDYTKIPEEDPDFDPNAFKAMVQATSPLEYNMLFGNKLGQTPSGEKPGPESLNEEKPAPEGITTPTTEDVTSTTGQEGSPFTLGDLLGLTGTGIGSVMPGLTTIMNRMTDSPNINPYLGYGQKGLAELESMKGAFGQLRDEAKRDLGLLSRTARKQARGSARSINTLRAMDQLANAREQERISDINATYANQIAGISKNIASAMDARDKMVMMGEEKRDLADRMDRDNFYTELNKDFGTLSQGLQKVGKDLNVKQADKDFMNILPMMNKYGISVRKGKGGKFEMYNTNTGKALTDKEAQEMYKTLAEQEALIRAPKTDLSKYEETTSTASTTTQNGNKSN